MKECNSEILEVKITFIFFMGVLIMSYNVVIIRLNQTVIRLTKSFGENKWEIHVCAQGP